MNLKEARYILAIAEHKSIGKAAKALYISQPSLSKYLKNLEQQLDTPLFSRIDNMYIPTYTGERYLHYAEQIVMLGDEWDREYEDITRREHGKLTISAPVMMANILLLPTLTEFHERYPNVAVDIMEEVNFVTDKSRKSYADLTLCNVREFPKFLDCQQIGKDEMVLILPKGHPLSRKAQTRTEFHYPWLDLSLCAEENFILLYPDQNSGMIALDLFEEYQIHPPVILRTRNNRISIQLAMEGMGVTFAPARYFACMNAEAPGKAQCYSVGTQPVELVTIAASQPKRYLPQYAKDYIRILQTYIEQKMTLPGRY